VNLADLRLREGVSIAIYAGELPPHAKLDEIPGTTGPADPVVLIVTHWDKEIVHMAYRREDWGRTDDLHLEFIQNAIDRADEDGGHPPRPMLLP
jgi:hypothetical protein